MVSTVYYEVLLAKSDRRVGSGGMGVGGVGGGGVGGGGAKPLIPKCVLAMPAFHGDFPARSSSIFKTMRAKSTRYLE